MRRISPVLRVRQAQPEVRQGQVVRPFDIEIFRGNVSANEKYGFMCAAIDSDIESATGSGAKALEELRRIQAGEIAKIESGGNAWVTHITPSKVWFEGLYSQGTGGEVTFAQYKLAVETYVRFLSDPERVPLEVPFPEN